MRWCGRLGRGNPTWLSKYDNGYKRTKLPRLQVCLIYLQSWLNIQVPWMDEILQFAIDRVSSIGAGFRESTGSMYSRGYVS